MMLQSSERYLIGIDLGKARCGLATAHDGSRLALPLAVVNTEPVATLAQRIALALGHRIPVTLVAGLPLNERGGEGESAIWARNLAERLAMELDVPQAFVDERFSTREAYGIRQQAGAKAKRNRESIDAAAATLILQAYLDRQQSV